MDDYRYTYAVARINALSTKLLDRVFVSRMLAAEPDEILRILGETAYAESLAGVEGPAQLEKGLIRELKKTHALLGKICPDKSLIALFRIRYDFHNLKAMLKSRLTGLPYSDSIIDLGTYGIDELSAAVGEGAYRFVPEHIRDTALNALEEYDKAGALYAISYTCDRSMWTYLLQNALKLRNRVVINLFREYINLANIKSFFRVKEFAENREVFERYFIPGGSYSLDFFFRHLDAQLSHFLDHLAKTRYEHHIVSHGLRMWPEDKSFWRMEVASDNLILHQFSNMRMMLFSIAPLIYYLLRKEAEAKLIRTIVRCKLIGMARGGIEERLRYLYV
jgi:V/A-type H+-transporting ATPase subunit C